MRKDYIDELMYKDIPANYVQPIQQQPVPVQQVPIANVPVQQVQQVPVAQALQNYVQPIPVQQVQQFPQNYVQPMQQPAVYYPEADPSQFIGEIEMGPMEVKQVNQPETGESASVYQDRWKALKQDTADRQRDGEPQIGEVYKKKWESDSGQEGKKGKNNSYAPSNLVQVPDYLRKSLATQPQGLSNSTYSQIQEQNKRINDQSMALIGQGVATQEAAIKSKGKMYDDLKSGLDAAYGNEIQQIANLRDGYKDKDGNIVKGFNEKFNNLLSDLDNQYKEFSNQKIDNNRLFNNMSTGRRVLVGIGMFLSAFSPQSTKNAIGIIEGAINRDIAAQKEEFRRGRLGVTGKQNQLALLTSKYNSDITASNALATLQKRKVIDTIDAQIRKAGNQQEIGKLKLLKAQMLQSLKKNMAKMSDIELRAYDTQVKMQNADPVMQIILRKTSLLPKDPMRKEAVTEVTEFRKEQGALKQVDSVFSDFMGADQTKWDSFLSAVPLTGSTAERVTAFARFFGPVKTLINEAVTTGEIKVFGPLIPKKYDSPERLRFKRDAFKEALINRFSPKTNANALLPDQYKLKHFFIKEKAPKTR